MQELLQITKRLLKPSEFAKVFFDFEPYPYQKEALDCTDRFTMLNWGRQTGKSTITAISSLFDALTKEDQTNVILAPKQQQAGRLFKRVRQLLRISDRKYPELELLSNIDRETQRLYEFKNGSSIECLTIGDDGGNVKGITANRQDIDEVAQQKNEEAWTAINPMLIATKGKQRLISTPKGINNRFYQCFKNKSHTYFHATSFENPNADFALINADKEWMPDVLWREEYLAEWIEDSNMFYPIRLIDNRMRKEIQERHAPLEQCTYYLGVDPATVGLDDTVFAILEVHENWKAIVRYIETKHEDPMQTSARVMYLHDHFRFQKVYIDMTGMGEGIESFLKSKNLPVEGIRQTQKSKEDMHVNCKTQLENGLTLLWNDKARKQFADMVYEYTPEKILKIYSQQSRNHKLPGGDDYPTAVALAVLGLRTPVQPILFARSTGVFGE